MPDTPRFAQLDAIAILGADEPPPVAVHNAGADSPFLLVGDHAGNRIPSSLAQLGLGETETTRHIAWDIGIAELGICLADRISALFIRQLYSRLVIDCNRRPGAIDSIPAVSDGTAVPGNESLDAAAASARAEAIHEPYQAAISAELDRRAGLGLATTLVALHSFTPAMGGHERRWHAGILHDRGDSRFARAMLEALSAEPELIVGDNEPYAMNIIDFTIPFHAYPRSLPYVEIEIRQDLLSDRSGIEEWCERLQRVLSTAQAGYQQLPR